MEGTCEALADPGKRWPRDNEFLKAIRTYSLYTDSRAEQRRLVLESLELIYGVKERAVLDGLTVEHVMPQSLTPEWREALGERADEIHRQFLHTLGNLTLTGYNSPLSNDPFASKRKTFARSPLAMNREIATESTWSATQILERADRLGEKALSIWPGSPPRVLGQLLRDDGTIEDIVE